MTIIDISVGLESNIVKWPGSIGFDLEWTKKIAGGDDYNNSCIKSDVHIGTHVDAPYHFIDNGETVEQLPLDVLIGPAYVVDLHDIAIITASDLSVSDFPKEMKRLLVKTTNSIFWETSQQEFRRDFVALTEDAAHWIVHQGIELIGIDYLSVQRFSDSPTVHKILMEKNVIIVEGLNLSGVEPGEYELICLPIKIIGAEGAPARAVLRSLNKGDKG